MAINMNNWENQHLHVRHFCISIHNFSSSSICSSKVRFCVEVTLSLPPHSGSSTQNIELKPKHSTYQNIKVVF